MRSRGELSVGVFARYAAAASLCVSVGCDSRSDTRAKDTKSVVSRATDTIRLHIEPREGGKLIIATGDSLSLVMRAYRCFGDDCDLARVLDSTQSDIRWSTSEPRIATVHVTGALHGIATGSTTVAAFYDGESYAAPIVVLPPIARLRWQWLPARPRVGDTLAVSVIALDSAGRPVARLAPAAHIMGTGRTGEVHWRDDTTTTQVVINGPGLLELVARLSHRTDTLRLRVPH